MQAIQLSLALGEACSLGRAFAYMLRTIECRPATWKMHLAHTLYLIEGTGKRGGVRRPGIGDRDVSRIGYPEIMAWYRNERLHGLSKESCKKRLSTLKLGLLAACELRALERLPQFPSIRSDTKRGEAWWTRDEFERAIAECDDEDMAAWFTVGWWTGMRSSDINRFRWDDVDLVRGTWTRAATKTGVPPALLPLEAPFRAWLEDRRQRLNPHPRDLVVRVRQQNPNVYLRGLCERAGVTSISTKGLRHGRETYLYETGADVATQVLQMGLTSERMLRVYRHPSAAFVKLAAQAASRKPPTKKNSRRKVKRDAGLQNQA